MIKKSLLALTLLAMFTVSAPKANAGDCHFAVMPIGPDWYGGVACHDNWGQITSFRPWFWIG